MLLAGGGTGGHVSPLLAVVEAMRELRPQARFLYVGGSRGLEGELVRAAGLPFLRLPLASLRDPDSVRALARQLAALPLAIARALVPLVRFRPHVCLTSGGFSAIPAVLLARALRAPVYLWEGNLIPGRANRALARWCARVAVTFPETVRHLSGSHVTGNPVRSSLLRWTREEGRAALGIADGPVVLITGGSQGAEAVNEAVWRSLRPLVDSARVVHQTGAAGLERAERERSALPDGARERYLPRAFFREDMGAALAAADLVVGRAGSSSIAEPLAFGTPLVLIPFGAALAGHQAANARAAEAAGAAVVIAERELDGQHLAAAVAGLLRDRERLARMADAARRLGSRDAARQIASEVLTLGGCA